MIVRAIFGTIAAFVGSASSFVCDDGSTLPPVHIQFSAMVDMAAFPEDFQNYRNNLLEVISSLDGTFGTQSEVEIYAFTNRPVPGTTPTDSWCGRKITGFTTAADAGTSLSQEFSSYGLLSRPMTDTSAAANILSSLNDNVWHSLKSDSWLRTAIDSKGLPVVHFMHISTDTVPWRAGWSTLYSGKSSIASVTDFGMGQPIDWCEEYEYLSEPEMVTIRTSLVPQNHFFLHLLIAEGPSITTIPSTVNWFQSFYAGYMGDPTTRFDILTNGSPHKDLILQRIGEAACQAAKLVSEASTDPCDKDPIVALISCTNQPDWTFAQCAQ